MVGTVGAGRIGQRVLKRLHVSKLPSWICLCLHSRPLPAVPSVTNNQSTSSCMLWIVSLHHGTMTACYCTLLPYSG